MTTSIANRYAPDFASPPGDTLLETLESLGMSQAELAERTGRTRKTINEIIRGKAPITHETAVQLELVLGVPASFWLNRERHYREFLAHLEEQERLRSYIPWLKNLPVRAMMENRWIEPVDDPIQQVQEMLRFFGVASPDQWKGIWLSPQVSFRKSPAFAAKPGAVAAWLRKGELEAQRMASAQFDARAFRGVLSRIRHLTAEPPSKSCPEVVRLCAGSGVAVVFVRELPGAPISGATRWLSGRAVVQLSLRYKTDDHLWFSFFHEAGHILLHGRKAVFLEGAASASVEEQQADLFARDMLIPKTAIERFTALGARSKAAIARFASEIGVAPGIVVGRLQHDEYLEHSHCNDLKRRLVWS